MGIKTIFQDHWLDFAALNAGKIRPSVHKEVSRMMSCQDMDNGFTLYRCPDCAKEVIIPFTCKSRFCTSCGKLYRNKWAEKLESRLLNCPHKHYDPICPMLMLSTFIDDGIPQEHKERQDIELDYLRRSNVLVVCGSRIDEAVKNDIAIAIAERYRIPATTLSGIVTVKSHGQEALPDNRKIHSWFCA